MHRYLVGVTAFFAVISGTSKPLVIGASLFIIVLAFLLNCFKGVVLSINRVGRVGLAAFVLLLGVTLSTLPSENIPKFAMTLASAVLASMLIRMVGSLSLTSRSRVCTFVLNLIIVGDLVHLSGLLGADMNGYKTFVNFDELSNLERERQMGFFSARFYGWFAEPSYHGAFVGLFCSLIWNRGRRGRALLYSIIGFVLCPSPMQILAFLFGVLLNQRRLLLNAVRRPLTVATFGSVAAALIGGLFYSRLGALYTGAVEVIAGENANISEVVRLVYPVLALVLHVDSYGFWPAPYSCIEEDICLPQSIKLPFISYVIFFGLSGFIVVVMAIGWLFRVGAVRVVLIMIVASILAGGGGFLLHYWLMVALLIYAGSINERNIKMLRS